MPDSRKLTANERPWESGYAFLGASYVCPSLILYFLFAVTNGFPDAHPYVHHAQAGEGAAYKTLIQKFADRWMGGEEAVLVPNRSPRRYREHHPQFNQEQDLHHE